MGGMSRAKRSLSQNFLIDPNLQRKIVSVLAPIRADTVLEVGPGHGELAQHMVGTVRHLVLVEKDRDLAAALEERWGGRADVDVVEADALQAALNDLVCDRVPYRVVSNVPYNITSPLLFTLLELEPAPTRVVVTVQKEVAERIVASPGSRVYGALSVGVQTRAEARLEFRIRRGAFRPVPDVDSAVVCIEPQPDRLQGVSAQAVRRLTRVAFGQRRKQLQRILRMSPDYDLDAARIDAACAHVGLDPRTRPERISPDEFVRLAAVLDPHRAC